MLFPSLSSLLFAFFFFAMSWPAVLPSHVERDRKNLGRSTPKPWTNAQRLAAGLPPLAPRRFKYPTAVEPGIARRAHPSPSPSPTHHPVHVAVQTSFTGTLQVHNLADNSVIGFVQLSSSGVTLGSGSGTPVTFTAAGNTPFSIATVASGKHGASFLGGVGDNALASGSANAVAITNVVETTSHARPTMTGGESAIWTIDASTLKLTPWWVNPDGSHARTVLAFSPSDGALILTGDVSAFNQAHSDAPVSEVTLLFVSN